VCKKKNSQIARGYRTAIWIRKLPGNEALHECAHRLSVVVVGELLTHYKIKTCPQTR
jgi:hypothetical protein